MSFTFSHPAVVLPLMALPKKWRSATGLVIGSLVPDFEKFIRMSEHDPHSHTWGGIFYLNLPLGLLLSFLFHLVVRDPLIRNLPKFLRVRFRGYITFDWLSYFRRHYILVLLSLLVGILSHFALDIMTHPPGHRELFIPYLGNEILTAPISSKMNLTLEIIMSLGGLIASLVFILLLPKQQERLRKRRIDRYWAVYTAVTMLIFLLRSQIGDGIKQDPYHPIIVLMSAGLFALVITPYLLKITPSHR